MASVAVVARDGYYRNASGQFASRSKNPPIGCPDGLGIEAIRERDSGFMKVGGGHQYLYDSVSDDSSSHNRKSMSLNADVRKGSAMNVHSGNSSLLGSLLPVPASEMSKDERSEWRRRLKRDLDQVRNLSLRIEAREQQLRGMSHSVGINPSLSDAQFSGNDVRSYAGKEVTSGLDMSPRANFHSQRETGPARQHSLPALDMSRLPDISLKEKRTPKANQLYPNSDFVMGKDKMPPPEKLKSKSSTVKRPGLTRTDSRDSKRQMVNTKIQNKQYAESLRQCSILLKKLMSHKHAWVFNEPVDAVKLGLSDYHQIIKEPMDLGTIKGRLQRREYIAPLDFADDVWLTFNNATTYNPPGSDVHIMAEVLRGIFEEKWKRIESKYEEEHRSIEDTMRNGELALPDLQPARRQLAPPPQLYVAREDSDQSQAKPKKTAPSSGKKLAPLSKPKAKPKPKRDMNFSEKKRLSGNLQLLPPDKLEYIVQLMKERNPNLNQKEDEIEVDFDTFDNDTLWEIHRYVAGCMKNLAKNRKKPEVDQSQQLEDNSRGPSNQLPRVVPDGSEEVLNKNRKGELGDEDVDIDDDLPYASFPPVEIEKDAGYASRSSSSGSSSSDSGSSSDSDSESSSGSDSDAEDAQSADGR